MLPLSDSLKHFRAPAVRLGSLLPGCLFLALGGSSFGVTSGQIDTFQDGTTQGWVDPALNTSNIANNGPAGAGDHYLQIASGTYGGGVRLTTFNRAQWLGNYISAGVTGISMDLRNFGPNALPIRIAIREGTGNSLTPGYASTVAFNLPADGQWHSAFFSLSAGTLTPVHSPQALATDLANVADLRLLSSVSPNTVGDAINAEIGVDNIVAVPEPGCCALLGAGLLCLVVSRNRRPPD